VTGPGARRGEAALALLFLVLTIGLALLPTGFEDRLPEDTVRCRGRVVDVDNAHVHQYGIVRAGVQGVTLSILDGPFKGRQVECQNELLGKMDMDKVFAPGDTALAVLMLRDGDIAKAVAQDYYRLDAELVLLVLFAALLMAFGGLTGLKAILSFAFSVMVIWKVLVPSFLHGRDPVLMSLAVTTAMVLATVFLVAGPTRKGATAFLGSFMGIVTTCLLAWFFIGELRLHGAVRPFSETILHSGYPHLDLTRIFLASVFMACSGAIMDLAMDVAASLEEVAAAQPGITFRPALLSGLRVGRAVVGTMTTTLLLAYSGGYVTLLMVFMAQGIPMANVFNLTFVSAEILNTLVGSFGLVAVAPFTALVGAFLFTRRPRAR
jgi:uncharacterized membrane protein